MNKPAIILLFSVLLSFQAASQIEFNDSSDIQFRTGLDMNSNSIVGLPDATASSEPVTLGQIGSGYVSRSGDSMTGNLDMKGNNINNISIINQNDETVEFQGDVSFAYKDGIDMGDKKNDIDGVDRLWLRDRDGSGDRLLIKENKNSGNAIFRHEGSGYNDGDIMKLVADGKNVRIPNGLLNMTGNDVKGVEDANVSGDLYVGGSLLGASVAVAPLSDILEEGKAANNNITDVQHLNFSDQVSLDNTYENGGITIGEVNSGSIDGVQGGAVIGKNAEGNSHKRIVVIGNKAEAANNDDTVIGYAADGATQATIIGSYASSVDRDAVAIGYNATSNQNSVVIGHEAYTKFTGNTDRKTVVIGANAAVEGGDGGVAMGYEAMGGQNTVAIGREVEANQDGAVAIGYKAKAPNKYEATFGNLNGQELDVNVTGNVTVHENLEVKGSCTGCGGGGATEDLSETLAAGAVANQTIKMQDETLSFNNYNIYSGSGVRIGDSSSSTDDSDDVAIGTSADASAGSFYEETAIGNSADVDGGIGVGGGQAFGSGTDVDGEYALAVGPYAEAQADTTVSIGRLSSASTEDSIAIGYYAGDGSTEGQRAIVMGAADTGTPTATGDDSIGIGTDVTASDSQAVALGDSSSASGSQAVALGEDSSASGNDAVALGTQSDASYDDGIAIGRKAFTGNFGNKIAIGLNANASGDADEIAIGNDATASGNYAVAIGNQADAPNSYEATFGNLNGEELDVNVTGNLTVHGKGGIDEKNVRDISYSTGHTSWGSGLSDEEVNRFGAASGETIEIDRLDVQLKGGGSNSDFDVDIYDAGSATVLDSTTAGTPINDVGTASQGSDVLVRVNNSAGSSVTASITVSGQVVG